MWLLTIKRFPIVIGGDKYRKLELKINGKVCNKNGTGDSTTYILELREIDDTKEIIINGKLKMDSQ